MKFKGIPMEGTLQSFTNKLKEKGYALQGIQDGVAVLKGEFAGYKDCKLIVVTDKSGTLCKTVVIFPKMDKWAQLETCYNRYKSMLSEKYGNPSDCVEHFDNSYVDDDNGRMHELRMDRCKYITMFETDKGSIRLKIEYENFESHVVLSYFDGVNQEKLRKQIMDDL